MPLYSFANYDLKHIVHEILSVCNQPICKSEEMLQVLDAFASQKARRLSTITTLLYSLILAVKCAADHGQEWRQAHPDSKGNIRDEASLQQLIVLANMESINAELIRQGVPQSERLLRLNASAKQMMQSLTNDHRIEAFKEYGTLPHESE